MKTRRLISTLFALLMVLNAIPHSALAAEWYLENGSIQVVADDNGQTVYQGSNSGVQDNAPVITQLDTSVATDSTITLESSAGATVTVTIENVLMTGSTTEEEEYTLIDVVGDSNAVVNLEGDNCLEAGTNYGNAIIHVGEGSLTIQGEGSVIIDADSNGAKIGSHNEEDFSGSITIGGDVEIVTYDSGSYDGAAIGSGQHGDFTGSVVITDNAEVYAKSNDRGAGIGAGEYGDFRGSVTIEGDARVRADGDDDSAGIGSGENSSFSGGSILIQGNATVIATGSDEGPGIGAADDTPMNGTIIIRDDATVTVGTEESGVPGIGSEGGYFDTGIIRIEGNASVETMEGDTLILGSEYADADTNMSIFIGDTVTLNGTSGEEVLAGLGDVELRAHYINCLPPVDQSAAFWVLDENCSQLSYTTAVEEDTLVISVDAAYASFHAIQGGIQQLRNQGIEEIRFVTTGATSAFDLDDLAEACVNGTEIVLTHNAEEVLFTLGGKDAKSVLD